jgi:hypothetical protein
MDEKSISEHARLWQ